ncbi:MAG: hypothetical protein GPJ54_02595 [Candidatus Heimdallarchaeota archaeon]|nr:hypothetical protein [Candidatus Heimdallarchaeota archaeon]
MDIVERLTPDSDIKATLESLLMPVVAAGIFLVLWIILNLIDGDDETMIGLPDSSGFVLVALLIAFWIGIVAVNEGGNIGDALVGAAIFGLLYGILISVFQEVFFADIKVAGVVVLDELYTDGFFGKAMILNILSWLLLFVMAAFVGAGLAEDMFGESEPKAKKASAKKAPAKKAPAKKKTTKKATKAADE